MSTQLVAKDPKNLSGRRAERQKEGDARRRIAYTLVYGYIGVILLNIVGPVLIVKLLGSSNSNVAALKSISEVIAPIISSVVGVLGFVLGYYFKSEEGRSR